MSASREKKKRLEQVETETGSANQSKKGLGKTGKTVIGIVVALAVVALVIFFGMINTGFFEKHTTAATINDHKLTPADMNYYYATTVQNNQQILSMVADPEIPLSEQPYMNDDYESWADYLLELSIRSASQVYAIYDAAVAEGFTLSEEAAAALDQQLESYSAMAPMYGAPNGDALVAATYGKGCNLDNYRDYMMVNMIAQEYTNSVVDSFTYTQEEMDAYYSEHTDDLDGYSFRQFAIAAEVGEEEDTPSEEAMKNAEEEAKAMAEAAQGNEQAFLDAVKEANTDTEEELDPAETTLREDVILNRITEGAREWMKDPARQAGDTTYVINGYGDGYEVLQFIGKADHSYMLPTVRHILFTADSESEAGTEAAEAAKELAKSAAESALEEFLAGDATEDAFAEMAKTMSADTGSAAEGGLIADIIKGTMVPEFEAWAYDEARKPGDTGVVETEYGYHVMFYVGSETSFHDYQVKNSMMNEDYAEWSEEIYGEPNTKLISSRFMSIR